MAQVIKLKRSNTPGKIPLVSDLSLGEIGINTFDGKAYIKKDDGVEAIVPLGSGGSGGLGGTYETKTANFAATANTAYLVDTSTSAITVTLPAAPDESDAVKFVDFKNNSQTHNITIARNGNDINNLAEDLIIDYNGISVELVFSDGNWVIADTGAVNNPGYLNSYEYTATAGQTIFLVDYVDPKGLIVTVNGVVLGTSDYVASNGTSVVLNDALLAGDTVRLISISNIKSSDVANLYSGEWVATAGQTTFPIAYDNLNSMMVFKNGVQLSTAQYTATSGTEVVLDSPCTVGDIVRIIAFYGTTMSGFAPLESPLFTGYVQVPKMTVYGAGFNVPITLTDGATINWDWSNAQSAMVTLGGNRTLANPTNAVDGQYSTIRVNRTGAYVLSFGNAYKGLSGIGQSQSSGRIDHFVFRYNGTNYELVGFRADIGA
jgi:hypothetical protein